ncbi:hypothetical protein SEA_KEELAN_97 [Gordonia phage Keelan]|nr:hypothetical protein SEA_KEELAN_97 [Gordonia phage Keelan]
MNNRMTVIYHVVGYECAECGREIGESDTCNNCVDWRHSWM